MLLLLLAIAAHVVAGLWMPPTPSAPALVACSPERPGGPVLLSAWQTRDGRLEPANSLPELQLRAHPLRRHLPPQSWMTPAQQDDDLPSGGQTTRATRAAARLVRFALAQMLV
jgi:hypothetical protein